MYISLIPRPHGNGVYSIVSVTISMARLCAIVGGAKLYNAKREHHCHVLCIVGRAEL